MPAFPGGMRIPAGEGEPWEGDTVPSCPVPAVAGGHGRDQRPPLRGGDAGGAAPSAGPAGAPRPSPSQENPPGPPGAGGESLREWGGRLEGDGGLARPSQGRWGVLGVSPRPLCSPQGTNYRKTNPALELQRTQRDSFWEQAEVRGRGAGEGLGGPHDPLVSRGWHHGCCLGLGLPGAEPGGPGPGAGSLCRYQWQWDPIAAPGAGAGEFPVLIPVLIPVRAQREEQQRKEQERQREREQRRRWERERMEEERLQAAERERRLQERERLIEERR